MTNKELKERIAVIDKNLSYLNFKDTWDEGDYILSRKCHEELTELKKLYKPEGYYMTLEFEFKTSSPIYFTGDKILTCGDEPYYFDTIEEAVAKLMASDVAYKFKAMTIRKAGE